MNPSTCIIYVHVHTGTYVYDVLVNNHDVLTPPLSNNRTSHSLGSERTERGRPGTGASARIWYRNPYPHTYKIRALISGRNKLIWVRNKGPYFGTK